MSGCNGDILAFAADTLAPAAVQSLQGFYHRYQNGDDLKAELKADDSPASLADRETERILREMIAKEYPNHGIWGEEFGGEYLAADYVWVLDPLDGTREFLAQKPGQFGSLIGLLYQGNPILGLCIDPVHDTFWIGAKGIPPRSKPYDMNDKIRISCTNPKGMFKGASLGHFDALLDHMNADLTIGQNALGFCKTGSDFDLAVENDLAFHDILALLPILTGLGLYVCDFAGKPYTSFDVKNAVSLKYSLIAAKTESLAMEAVKYMKGSNPSCRS